MCVCVPVTCQVKYDGKLDTGTGGDGDGDGDGGAGGDEVRWFILICDPPEGYTHMHRMDPHRITLNQLW